MICSKCGDNLPYATKATNIYGICSGCRGTMFDGCPICGEYTIDAKDSHSICLFCADPSSWSHDKWIKTDLAVPVKQYDAKVPVENDFPCPQCGQPKYSTAERDAGIPCWICGYSEIQGAK